MNGSWARVFLARHGQTEWNLEGRRQGQLDSALTVDGVEQAHRHAATLRPYAIDGIFTSPLGRATATAGIIGAHLGLAVTVVDELTEVDHGRLAGLTDKEIMTGIPTTGTSGQSTSTGGPFPTARATPTPTYAQSTPSPESVNTRRIAPWWSRTR